MNSYVGFNKTKPTPYLSISHFPEYVDPTKDRQKQQNKKHYRKREKRLLSSWATRNSPILHRLRATYKLRQKVEKRKEKKKEN